MLAGCRLRPRGQPKGRQGPHMGSLGAARVHRHSGSQRLGPIVAGTLVVTLVPLIGSSGSASASPPACQSSTPGGPVFITPTCQDPALNQPYVDVEQPGTTTDPATNITVSYTYVHGGFIGTNTKFAFYFPAPTKYQGRFFESTYPTVSQEAAAPSAIVFGVSNGAYVVSSNNNGGVPAGAPLAGYRANAAAAKYSRVV